MRQTEFTAGLPGGSIGSWLPYFLTREDRLTIHSPQRILSWSLTYDVLRRMRAM